MDLREVQIMEGCYTQGQFRPYFPPCFPQFLSKEGKTNTMIKNNDLNNLQIIYLFFYESFKYFLGSLFLQRGYKSLIGFFYCCNSFTYRWKKFYYYLELKNDKN